jgi:hypothetical protein
MRVEVDDRPIAGDRAAAERHLLDDDPDACRDSRGAMERRENARTTSTTMGGPWSRSSGCALPIFAASAS